MKQSLQSFLILLIIILFSTSLYAQKTEKKSKKPALETAFPERQAIIKTIENFYIGDHTGSIKLK